ncbi:MAG: hypothetical protein ACKVOX_07285 [Rhizobacter sp.]
MAEMTPTRKRIAILIVVAGSALIGERVVTLLSDGNDVVEPAAGKRTRTPANVASRDAVKDSGSSGAVQTDRLDARQRLLAEGADAVAAGASSARSLFEPVAWKSAAAIAQAATPPAPPPQPVAPPFPYAYLGGLLEDGVRTTFFTKGDRVLPVKAGDTVDAVYRVDQMNEKQMTLTYLPLNQSLTLALGSAR